MATAFLIGVFKCFFGIKYEKCRIFLTGWEFGCCLVWYTSMIIENQNYENGKN